MNFIGWVIALGGDKKRLDLDDPNVGFFFTYLSLPILSGALQLVGYRLLVLSSDLAQLPGDSSTP